MLFPPGIKRLMCMGLRTSEGKIAYAHINVKLFMALFQGVNFYDFDVKSIKAEYIGH